jgi:hypothetical protein
MRFITIVAAWILGWIVYMIAMIVTVYDGLLSLIFQPIMAGLTSTAFVGAALLVGLVFRIPVVRKAWNSSRWCATLSAAGSTLVLCLGSALGFTAVFRIKQSRHIHFIRRIESSMLRAFKTSCWSALSVITVVKSETALGKSLLSI